MHALTDKDGNPIAYLYNNIILLAGSSEVTGVILGHCVFGKSGKVRARFFNHTLYAPTGEIIAEEKGVADLSDSDHVAIVAKGWELVQRIGDHECPRINPKKSWLSISIAESLS